MAIKLEHPQDKGLIGPVGGKPYLQKVIVIADTEAEITALGGVGSVVQETGTDMAVKPAVGSIAYTPDLTVLYMLSPSGVWTKAV